MRYNVQILRKNKLVKIVLQSPQVFASGSNQLLLASLAVNANPPKQVKIVLPQVTVTENNQQIHKNFTPDSIPNWLIYGVSALLIFIIGSALVLAREGRRARINAAVELFNLDSAAKTNLEREFPSVFSSRLIGSYIDEGFRSMFNKLVERIVLKNKEHLYTKYKQILSTYL